VSRGYIGKTGFLLALPRLPVSTGARVSLASKDLAALSAGENPLGSSSAGWRPDRALLLSLGGPLGGHCSLVEIPLLAGWLLLCGRGEVE
jgi:hypothetical protein